jgi:hypothetical protein
MRRAGGAAAVLVVLCAGCMGSGGEPEARPTTESAPSPPSTTQPAPEPELPDPEGWATRTERAWLEDYGRWTRRIGRSRNEVVEHGAEIMAGAEAGDPEVVRTLERWTAPMRSCLEDFERMVPAPPTVRLREAADLAGAACGHYARGADVLLQALREGEAISTIDPEAGRELARAVIAFGLVNDKVPPGGAQRLPILDESAGRSRINPRYGRAAALLAEKTAEVRCWEKRAWRRLLRETHLSTGIKFHPVDTAGYTGIAGRRIHLSPLVCGALDRLTYEHARPRDPEGRLLMSLAVGALAHEAFHRTGVIDEAAAECYGTQRIVETALELDVPRAYAEGLARVAWQTYGLLPRAYRSPECRNGRELDLDANSDVWP